MRSVARVLAFGLVSIAACHPMGPTNHGGGFSSGSATNAHFSPNSAVRDSASTASAIRFYPGDKSALQNVGATYIGDLDVDAQQTISLPFQKKPTAESLAARASSEAARVGATHYVLVEAGVDVKEYEIAPERTETESASVVGRDGRTHTQSVTEHKKAQSVRTETPRGRFALFRVDPARWSDLPAALRPVPLSPAPSDAATTTTTQGNVSHPSSSVPEPVSNVPPPSSAPTPAKRDLSL